MGGGVANHMRRRQPAHAPLTAPTGPPYPVGGLVTWWGAARWKQAGHKSGHACHLRAKLPAGHARSFIQPTLCPLPAPQTFCRDLSCADGTEGERWEAFAVSCHAGGSCMPVQAVWMGAAAMKLEGVACWLRRFGWALRPCMPTRKQFATCIAPHLLHHHHTTPSPAAGSASHIAPSPAPSVSCAVQAAAVR